MVSPSGITTVTLVVKGCPTVTPNVSSKVIVISSSAGFEIDTS